MSISTDIRNTIESAIVEMGSTHKERLHIIKGLWVALVAKQHLLMLGPGGTGKSFLCRDIADRIKDSTYYETALDETSDPGQIAGPVDIRAMKDEGKYRRRIDGMAPEADIWFVDEFFNANGPTRHMMMPMLNERIFHNNGHPTKIPLWSSFMGSNKLDADTDQAAVWDRIHLRYTVEYVQGRDNIRDMVADSIQRRVADYVEPEQATIQLTDLHTAHNEAMQLHVPDETWETFLDLKDELLHNGIEVSSRRLAEGMAAVLANAWLNGHDEVTPGDLDILQAMWWTLQADIEQVQKTVLATTNPGEKAALEFLDELEQYRANLRSAEDQDVDDTKKRLIGMETYKNAKRILEELDDLEAKAKAAGASTTRVEEARERTNILTDYIQREFFQL